VSFEQPTATICGGEGSEGTLTARILVLNTAGGCHVVKIGVAVAHVVAFMCAV